MSYQILLPLLYLLIGIGLSKSGLDKILNLRWMAAALLTRICIPIVVVYNIADHEAGVFTVMIAIIIIMAIMLYVALLVTKDAIISICYYFSNIGWFGLPIVLSVYGHSAALLMVAAYIGSSIFGNSIAVGVLIENSNKIERLKSILKSPTFIALIVGILCIPFGNLIKSYLLLPYDVAKVVMSIAGMLVLGLWMGIVKFAKQDFISSFILMLAKLIGFSLLATLFILYGYFFHINLIVENIKTIYFIGLLPPAANIIVLETYYCQTGRSAPFIAAGTVISIFFVLIYVSLTV